MQVRCPRRLEKPKRGAGSGASASGKLRCSGFRAAGVPLTCSFLLSVLGDSDRARDVQAAALRSAHGPGGHTAHPVSTKVSLSSVGPAPAGAGPAPYHLIGSATGPRPVLPGHTPGAHESSAPLGTLAADWRTGGTGDVLQAPPLTGPGPPRPRLLCSNLCPKVAAQEFQVPDEVLGLIYAQTVVWVGSFFCPLLPLLNTVKFLLLFYLKKVWAGARGGRRGSRGRRDGVQCRPPTHTRTHGTLTSESDSLGQDPRLPAVTFSPPSPPAHPLLHLLPGRPHLPGLRSEFLFSPGPPPGPGRLCRPGALQHFPVSAERQAPAARSFPPPSVLRGTDSRPLSCTSGSPRPSCVAPSGDRSPSGPRSQSPSVASLRPARISSSSWEPRLLRFPFCCSPGEGTRARAGGPGWWSCYSPFGEEGPGGPQ